MNRRIVALGMAGIVLVSMVMMPQAGLAQESGVSIQVGMAAISSLDPVNVSRFDDAKRDVVENVFVGLTRLNTRSGQVEPALAEEWSVSADGLVWTFTLRDDVQWVEVQNGEIVALRPVVAADVVFAVQRACDPRRPAPLTANMMLIVGCQETTKLLDTWRVDQAFLDAQVGVKALDEQTVEFRLLFPASYFLSMTSQSEFRPVFPERITGANEWPVLGNSVVSSGAWAVTRWDAGQIVLAANPFWPLERQGNVEQVTLRFDLQGTALVEAVNNGQIQAARVENDVARLLQQSQPTVLKSTEGETLALIGFSFEYPPLDNPLVRQALTQAIDRQALAAQLNGMGGELYQRVNRFTPNNVIATPSTQGVGFDVSAAQQSLANAGYAGCALPSKVTLVVENSPVSIAMGQFVVQQWQQNLGCTGVFEVATAERQALIDTAHGTLEASAEGVVSRFQAWLIHWTGDYLDANAWTSDALHCRFGFIKTGRLCDLNDTLLDQAGVTLDLQSRFNTYSQAEQGFFGSGGSFPVIPLVITGDYWVQAETLIGVASYGPFQFDRWIVEQ